MVWEDTPARTAGDKALRGVAEGEAADDVGVLQAVQLVAGDGVPHARAEVRAGGRRQHGAAVEHAGPHRAL